VIEPLTLTALQSTCNLIVARALQYDYNVYNHLYTLHTTGMRAGDLFALNSIVSKNTTSIIIQPQKNNATRSIEIDRIAPAWQSTIKDTNGKLAIYSVSTLIRHFNNLTPYPNLHVQNKQIATHIFRYTYIKYLRDAGLSLAQIKTIIGEKTTSAINMYLNASLYVS